ncbi:MAG: Crp/Fnr family transcriptional regulator [Sulfuritalea sp.]|nr:Crp/Fnr family transcriptional regulator [Sulfuritalea sp.]
MNNVSVWLMEQLLSEQGKHYATMHDYSAGESIFAVGDPGDYLAVLVSGCVEIRKGEKIVSIVDPGSMFGEMGIIDHKPRVASAIAKNQSRVAEIREGQFAGLLRVMPEFGLAVMRSLTDRLRRQLET